MADGGCIVKLYMNMLEVVAMMSSPKPLGCSSKNRQFPAPQAISGMLYQPPESTYDCTVRKPEELDHSNKGWVGFSCERAKLDSDWLLQMKLDDAPTSQFNSRLFCH